MRFPDLDIGFFQERFEAFFNALLSMKRHDERKVRLVQNGRYGIKICLCRFQPSCGVGLDASWITSLRIVRINKLPLEVIITNSG